MMENMTKNKKFLTKIVLAAPRGSLYVGVSAALLLSGCSASNLWSNATSSGSSQHVDGVRRTPALNNARASSEAAKMASPKLPKSPPMPIKAPESVAATISTPYDQYDAAGGEISAPVPSATASEGNGDFFSRLLGLAGASAKQPVPKESPLYMKRKLLPGNPYLPEGTLLVPFSDEKTKEVIETVKEPAKESMGEAVKENVPMTEISPAIDPVPIVESIPASEPAPIVESIKEVADKDIVNASPDETLLGRITSKLSIFDADKGVVSAPYPEISSVPPKPEEFEAVKRSQQQIFNELQAEHDAALEEKKSLDLEVSGALPEEKAPNKTAAPIASQKIIEHSPEENKIEQPAVVEEPSSFFERLADTFKPDAEKTVSEEVVAPVSEAIPEAVPEESKVKDTAEKIEPPAEGEGRGSFFERLKSKLKPEAENSVSDGVVEQQHPSLEAVAKETSEKSVSESLVVPPVEEEKMEESKPVLVEPSSADEVPSLFDRLKDAFKPDAEKPASEEIIAPSPVPVSSLGEVNIQAAPAETKEEYVAPKPDVPAASLPSPDIIKTMRPSRYEVPRSKTNSAY